RTAAALLIRSRPRVIDQDLTHHPRAHSEEVRPILPSRVLPIDELDVNLIHQRARFERMVRALVSHAPPGETFQFRKNDGPQLFQSGVITIGPRLQQMSYFRFRLAVQLSVTVIGELDGSAGVAKRKR